MTRGSRTASLCSFVAAALALLGISPAVAQTTPRPFINISSATIEPGGTVAIIRVQALCPKGAQLASVTVLVNQRRSSTETITEAEQTFAVRCAAKPTSLRAPTAANFPATRGFTTGPAQVSAVLSWYRPDLNGPARQVTASGTFALTAHATINPTLGSAHRLARGAALVIAPHVTCPAGQLGEIFGEVSQRLPNSLIQLQYFNQVFFDCTGSPQAVRVTVPAGAYAWGTGKTFLWVQAVCVGDCHWGEDFGTIGVTT